MKQTSILPTLIHRSVRYPRLMMMHRWDKMALGFHGFLVHGSFPNTTSDRFRRSLIGHYIEGDVEQVGA